MAITALDAGIDPRIEVTGKCLDQDRRVETIVELFGS
jgi:hypothetical protein